MKLKVKCSKCNGTGKADLTPELQATYDHVKRQRGDGSTAAEAKTALDKENYVSVTAFNNRLNDLWQLGLVRRERRGQAGYIYFTV